MSEPRRSREPGAAEKTSAAPASRKEVARALHDVVGQAMSEVLLELEMLSHATTTGEADQIMDSIRSRLDVVAHDMGQAVETLREPAAQPQERSTQPPPTRCKEVP